MKRFFALLMAALMAMTMVPALAIDGTTPRPCQHQWSYNDNNGQPTCTQGVETIRWCTICMTQEGYTRPALGHDYGDWVVTKEPTCIEMGEERNECRRCGLPWIRKLDALGHEWGEWYLFHAPTYTENGVERRDCLRGDVYELREIEKLIGEAPNQPEPPVDDDEEPWLSVVKSFQDEPANGDFFVENEVIDFTVTVTNNWDQPLNNVNVIELLRPITGVVATKDTLLPGESFTVEIPYTVSEQDCWMMDVVNVVSCTAVTDAGTMIDEYSNRVVARTGTEDKPDPMAVAKVEISAPANGEYYDKDETVIYTITVLNATGCDVDEAVVSDRLFSGEWQNDREIAAIENFRVGDSRSYVFTHQVNDADIANGWIGNFASVSYFLDGWGNRMECSEVVWVRAGAQSSKDQLLPPEETENPHLKRVPDENGSGDWCVRTLNALSIISADYTLHVCGKHQQAAASAAAALDLNDFAAARAAWTEAVNELYETVLSTANNTAACKTVLNAQTMFFAEVSAHENALLAAGAAQDEIALAVCEMLKQQCVDLCYELHTMPDDRADSYYGKFDTMENAEAGAQCAISVLADMGSDEHYIHSLCDKHAVTEALIQGQMKTRGAEYANGIARTIWQIELDNTVRAICNAAPESVRKAVAVDYGMFLSWAEAREAMLSMMYPKTTVDEMIAQMFHSRVLALCE